MKPIFPILLAALSLYSCKEDGMPARYRTNVTVERLPVTFPTEEVMKTAPALKTEKGNRNPYHIVVASFAKTERKKAEAVTATLKGKGYPARLVGSQQRYRISIESFPTEEKAVEAREKYRKIPGWQDAWVLRAD